MRKVTGLFLIIWLSSFFWGARGTLGIEATCFPAGTKISTVLGKVKIEEVKVGDKVLSQDEKGKQSISEVADIPKTSEVFSDYPR